MEFVTGFVSVLAGFFGGFAGGFLLRAIRATDVERRVDSLEARVYRMHNAAISGSGVEARAEASAREQEAMTKAVAIFQSAEGGERNKQLAGLALEYPDVAQKLLRKFGKGGFSL
jgi:hypothetical protein